ncbi:hypothetical protein ACFFGH_10670 [Lysobacter korlensis]|uniref:Uncharacterized protein n=1 Tax=Lysobacter korlensis TaxID=553636 RepID=A0ABV6RMU5_9GAMM
MQYRYATFIEYDPVAGVLDVAVLLTALVGGALAVLLGWQALGGHGGTHALPAAGVTLGVISLAAYALPALPQVIDVLTGISLAWPR